MDQTTWLTGPLGDEVAVESVDQERTGLSSAVMLWDRMRTTLQQNTHNSAQLLPNLSLAQWTSYQLLLEWWNGTTQDLALSHAAEITCRNASVGSVVDDSVIALWHESARLLESVYHQRMFGLFIHEFLDEESKMWWEPERRLSESVLDVLQSERKHCAELAAVQRVAYAFFAENLKTQLETKETLMMLKKIVRASLDSCPWLRVGEDLAQQPYFLWDVSNRMTVVVSELEICPPYVCVSHTWGRWREETAAKLEGVEWDIPHNSKFVVEELPETLLTAFQTGFVWFDLLCIPQDGSIRADLEIAKQAAIFGNASSAVIWANDVIEWSELGNLFKTIGAHYLEVSNGPKARPFYERALASYYSDQAASQESFNFKALEPWLTSLWTLQEACLRPDMAFFGRFWEPLVAGKSTIITLDCIVAFGKLLSTSVFEVAVEKIYPNGDIPPSPPCLFELQTLLVMKGIFSLNQITPSSVLTLGQFRVCTGMRARAIMSIVGATEWYKRGIEAGDLLSVEDELVQGMYPLQFLKEVAYKTGAIFYAALLKDYKYLSKVVSLKELRLGRWKPRRDAVAVGSALPFTSSKTYMVPCATTGIQFHGHGSLAGWEISRDGSVHATKVAIAHLENADEFIEMDEIYTPRWPEELDPKTQDLKQWLQKFGGQSKTPNFAIALFEYKGSPINPRTMIGLLLKEVHVEGAQVKLVKVGSFYTSRVGFAKCSETVVDWVIL